jgi:kynurenine formamidase
MGLADRRPPTPEEYRDYPKRFSNWGRWGANDELGTLNFITPETRRTAAALVRSGRAVSLSRPIDTHSHGANPFPAHHLVAVGRSGGLADYLGMFIHGFAITHLDALCHLTAADGSGYYNGAKLDRNHMPLSSTGTIEHWRDGIVTRGVLYDIPKLRGTASIEPGKPVHGWELVDAARAQGITPAAGDAVCIRSGFGPYFASHAEKPGFASVAGVHASCIEFLYETQTALLLWDFQDAPVADQGIPNPIDIPVPMHVHQVLIPHMAMPILDNADFEALASVCAAEGRYAFQLVIAPLVVEGGTGSPVNPIAIL